MDFAGAGVAGDARGDHRDERRHAMTPVYGDLWHAFLPETALLVGALFVLGIDLFAAGRSTAAQRLRIAATLALIALAAAVGGAFAAGVRGDAFGGVVALDPLSFATRLGVLSLA